MSIERVVAILTPVFGAVAAVGTGWLGKHAPGVHIPADQIVYLEGLAFTGATAAGLKWLHGRSQYVSAEKNADALEAKIRARIAASPQGTLVIGDVEKLLSTHKAEIESAIDSHVPKAVGESLRVLFGQLGAPVPASVDQGADLSGRAQADTSIARAAAAGAPVTGP